MPANKQCKPFIVPVFIPHAGCPHRCIFCDQTLTTGQNRTFPTTTEIKAIIAQFLDYRKERDRRTEISFYGGNFLGLPDAQIVKLLEIANGYIRQGHAHGIRFSTRPDTITPDRLALIKEYPISCVELGVQSMNKSVLTLSQRGHTVQNTLEAVSLLKKEAWCLGLQMMVGLPGDTPHSALESGRRIAALQPDFVRIYPCLVLEGSVLARLFAQGRYTPLSLEQAVEQVRALFSCFAKADIPVIRMGLQPTLALNAQTGVIAGPFHPAFGELVHAAVWLAAIKRHLNGLDLGTDHLEICVHPRQVSRLTGHNRHVLHQLKLHYGLKTVQTCTDADIPENTAMVNGRRIAIC